MDAQRMAGLFEGKTVNSGDGPLTKEESSNLDIVKVSETGAGNSREYLTARIAPPAGRERPAEEEGRSQGKQERQQERKNKRAARHCCFLAWRQEHNRGPESPLGGREAAKAREQAEIRQGERTDLKEHHADGMKLIQGSTNKDYLLRRLARMDRDDGTQLSNWRSFSACGGGRPWSKDGSAID